MTTIEKWSDLELVDSATNAGLRIRSISRHLRYHRGRFAAPEAYRTRFRQMLIRLLKAKSIEIDTDADHASMRANQTRRD